MNCPAFEEIGCTIRVSPPPGAPEGVQFLAEFELAVSKADYWGPEFAELPTSFLDTDDRSVIDEIMAQLNVWPGRLKFVRTGGAGIIRITTGAGGYWSYLGKGALLVPAGQPTMNLQWSGLRDSAPERRRVIPHEGGHARGYWHEHLRERFVRDINPALAYPYYAHTQGWGRATVDANVLRPVSEATIMATPPDGLSIMAYPIPGSITYSGNPIPGGTDLTETDRAFDLTIYPNPVTPPPEPVEPPGPPTKPKPDEVPVYDLRVGSESDRFTILGDEPILFRFKVPRKGEYVAATRGKAALTMDLLDAKMAVLASDRDFSGVGANAMVSRALAKGTYYLAVRGAHPEAVGTFRVKVAAI